MKIEKGEVFAIRTKLGYGFLQYVATGNLGMEIIRVLEPIKNTTQILLEEINMKERFSVQFVIKSALRKGLIERCGLFEIPLHYLAPSHARTQHIIRGEFLGWHIVDQQTMKRELKRELSPEDILLSPHGVPNDTLLIERLENNWRLEKWK